MVHFSYVLIINVFTSTQHNHPGQQEPKVSFIIGKGEALLTNGCSVSLTAAFQAFALPFFGFKVVVFSMRDITDRQDRCDVHDKQNKADKVKYVCMQYDSLFEKYVLKTADLLL